MNSLFFYGNLNYSQIAAWRYDKKTEISVWFTSIKLKNCTLTEEVKDQPHQIINPFPLDLVELLGCSVKKI